MREMGDSAPVSRCGSDLGTNHKALALARCGVPVLQRVTWQHLYVYFQFKLYAEDQRQHDISLCF